ncbi:MAG: hypothetical protein AAB499_00610 [Patescibacteria group bacterium]
MDRVFAQEDKLRLPNDPNLLNTGSLEGLFAQVITWTLAFLAVVAFTSVIYSGVLMITSGGDSAKFATAQKNLLWSIIGVIVATLAYVIVHFVTYLARELV